MVFTDLLFLFCFLPISVLLYKVAKNIKIQNILLVVRMGQSCARHTFDSIYFMELLYSA